MKRTTRSVLNYEKWREKKTPVPSMCACFVLSSSSSSCVCVGASVCMCVGGGLFLTEVIVVDGGDDKDVVVVITGIVAKYSYFILY